MHIQRLVFIFGLFTVTTVFAEQKVSVSAHQRLSVAEALVIEDYVSAPLTTLEAALAVAKIKLDHPVVLTIDLPQALDDDKEAAAVQPFAVKQENAKSVSITDIRSIALEHNLSLKIANIDPDIAGTFSNEEAAKFDNIIFANARHTGKNPPKISGDLVEFKSDIGELNQAKVRLAYSEDETRYVDGEAGILIPLRTGGTVKLSTPFESKDSRGKFGSEEYRSALKFSISQPLLRNAGIATNEASIEIAQFEHEASNIKARLQSIRIIAMVDKSYWGLYEAWNELDVRHNQYAFANQNLNMVLRRVHEGTSAAIEVNRAEFGVADRLDSLIVAKTKLKLAQRQLKFLLNDHNNDMDSAVNLVPSTEPKLVAYEFDREKIISLAKAGRLELLEQELKLAADLSKIDYLKNQTLPLFTLDYSYGALSNTRDSFSRIYNNVQDSNFNEWYVGLRFEMPITNEARRAQLNRAVHQRMQRLTTKTLQELSVRREIYDALDMVEQNWQRIIAARQQVLIAGLNYEAEAKQFNEGLRTMTEVLEMLTRLGESQVKEIRAITDYQVSLIDMAYSTGTLLGYSKVSFK